MKYIDAEKLIAEIERRIESWTIRGEHSPAGQGRDTCVSRVTELSDLLSFVTSLQQEQPDVDEPEYGPYARQYPKSEVSKKQPDVDLEKASRHVYESWNGGTMDDVRRDMVELGKVIKARNKE